MERWVQNAFFSMFFAGLTSVIAKLGLVEISANLGLALRTCFVFVFVPRFAGVAAARGHHPGQAIGAALIIAGLVVIARG